MIGKIIELTDEGFADDVVKASNDKPVLVDFWAEWCGPCKAVAPILDEVAKDEKYKDKLTITKLNIDKNPKTPEKYFVRGIPTLLLFKNGEVVKDHKVGALSKDKLKTFLDANL